MSRTFRFLPLVVCGGAAVLLALVLAVWMPRGVHALWVGESLADGGVLATGQVHLETTGEVSVEVDGEAIGSGAAICVTDTVTIAVPLSVQATGTSAVPALDRTSRTAAPGTVRDVDLDDINAALRSSPEPQLHLLHLEVTSAQAGTVRVDEVLSLSTAREAGWVSTVHVEIDLLFDSCDGILATSWDTTTTTDPVIFVFGAGSEGTIDWGDGSPLEAVRGGTQTHDYSEDGAWDVTVTGIIPSVRFNGSDALVSVNRWDEATRTTSLAATFQGADNLVYVTAPPATVTDMSHAFRDTTANPTLDGWDTSNVTNMSYMFSSARAFNGDLSHWDTSNVTNMSHMFQSALAFTGDLRPWNVLLIPQEPTNFRLNANPAMQSPIWGTEGMPVRSGAEGDDTPQADDTPVADDTRDELESATDSPETEPVDDPAEAEPVDDPAEAEPVDDPATGDAAPAQEPANPQQTDMLPPREETYEPSPIRAFLLAPSQES